jgi:hypothetical protein
MRADNSPGRPPIGKLGLTEKRPVNRPEKLSVYSAGRETAFIMDYRNFCAMTGGDLTPLFVMGY